MSETCAVLRFDGFLDISRYPEFRGALENVAPGSMIVDLRDATGVDSTFLSELLLFQRRHRPARMAVVISKDGDTARTFTVAGIARKLAVFHSIDEAATALAAEPAAEPF